MKTQCNVVLSGSGVRFYYFIGALKALEFLDFKINAIAGTSGGSLVASLYASIYNTNVLREKALDIDLNKYIGFNWKFWKGYSIYRFKYKKFRDLFVSLTGVSKIEDTYIPLKIVTTNITRSKIVVAQKGDIVTWTLASMSAPFVFPYLNIGNSKYVDGGICKNLLADAWIDRDNEYTVLIYFPTSRNTIKNPIDYIQALIGTSLNCNVDDEIEDVKREKNKLLIIPLYSDEPVFKFKLDKKTKEEMISKGFSQTVSYIYNTKKQFINFYPTKEP